MGNARSVIAMSGPTPLSAFAMNVTMAATKGAALSVEALEFLTHITARSAVRWRKIETGALRLLIWVAPRRTFSMSGRNTASRETPDQ
ncbi:hypothetical protein CSUI_000875 [Cystoisospora suis]|uniref:Uncharacterized protein n=1 Tax=Cystoisospora suis TaxID=483139 RepID=A0A2C6LET4_9APIC|nr:hypothetical protein CSUI_000875 [Cystoisospora suis]